MDGVPRNRGIARFIELCNRMPFPLREFIDRTSGSGRHYHPPIDLAMRWPPYSPDELELREANRPPEYFEVSHVHQPADRIAFRSLEQMGGAIGHTSGLAKVDFV